MIFSDIVAETMDRLNLTSSDATTRIGKRVNDRYKRATSSIGMETSRRVVVSAQAAIGNRTMTFTGIEKIIAVIDKTTSPQDVVLAQITFDEMHITPIKTEMPRHYAITRLHQNSVDIYLDVIPSTAFILYADGHANLSTLSGNQSPDFPESFHDILVFGAMADELFKMEKPQLAEQREADYERRLSDLRMWIAKSAYIDIHQGRYTGKTFRWTRDSQILWDS